MDTTNKASITPAEVRTKYQTEIVNMLCQLRFIACEDQLKCRFEFYLTPADFRKRGSVVKGLQCMLICQGLGVCWPKCAVLFNKETYNQHKATIDQLLGNDWTKSVFYHVTDKEKDTTQNSNSRVKSLKLLSKLIHPQYLSIVNQVLTPVQLRKSIIDPNDKSSYPQRLQDFRCPNCDIVGDEWTSCETCRQDVDIYTVLDQNDQNQISKCQHSYILTQNRTDISANASGAIPWDESKASTQINSAQIVQLKEKPLMHEIFAYLSYRCLYAAAPHKGIPALVECIYQAIRSIFRVVIERPKVGSEDEAFKFAGNYFKEVRVHCGQEFKYQVKCQNASKSQILVLWDLGGYWSAAEIKDDPTTGYSLQQPTQNFERFIKRMHGSDTEIESPNKHTNKDLPSFGPDCLHDTSKPQPVRGIKSCFYSNGIYRCVLVSKRCLHVNFQRLYDHMAQLYLSSDKCTLLFPACDIPEDSFVLDPTKEPFRLFKGYLSAAGIAGDAMSVARLLNQPGMKQVEVEAESGYHLKKGGDLKIEVKQEGTKKLQEVLQENNPLVWQGSNDKIDSHFKRWVMQYLPDELKPGHDLTVYMRGDMPNWNTLGIYIKYAYFTTPPHIEPGCLSSVNLNHGKGTAEWFFVDPQDTDKFRQVMLDGNKEDLVSNVDYCHATKWTKDIKIHSTKQGPGDLVCIAPGVIHFVRQSKDKVVTIQTAYDKLHPTKQHFEMFLRWDKIFKNVVKTARTTTFCRPLICLNLICAQGADPAFRNVRPVDQSVTEMAIQYLKDNWSDQLTKALKVDAENLVKAYEEALMHGQCSECFEELFISAWYYMPPINPQVSFDTRACCEVCIVKIPTLAHTKAVQVYRLTPSDQLYLKTVFDDLLHEEN